MPLPTECDENHHGTPKGMQCPICGRLNLSKTKKTVHSILDNIPKNGKTAFTAEEMRTRFLGHIIHMIGYWNGEGSSNVDPNRTSRDKMEGLVHSILVMIDGGSGDMPAFDISCAPHPDDEAYHKKNGERWVPAGKVINDCQLHDEYNNILNALKRAGCG